MTYTLHHLELDDIKAAARAGTLARDIDANPRTKELVVLFVEEYIHRHHDPALKEQVQRLGSQLAEAMDDASSAHSDFCAAEETIAELQKRLAVYEREEVPYGSTCKGCGKDMLWARTRGGKQIPLDCRPVIYRNTGETDNDGVVIVERLKGAAVSHFATCSKANEFSQSNKAEKS